MPLTVLMMIVPGRLLLMKGSIGRTDNSYSKYHSMEPSIFLPVTITLPILRIRGVIVDG